MRTILYLPIGAILWAVMATGLETPAAAQTSASPTPVPRASSTLPPRGPATFLEHPASSRRNRRRRSTRTRMRGAASRSIRRGRPTLRRAERRHATSAPA